MRVGHEEVFHIVLVPRGHAGHALAAAALGLVGVDRHAFDVADVADRDDAGLVGYEVFHVDIAFGMRDVGAPLVAVLRFELEQVRLDQAEDLARIVKQVAQVGDALDQFEILRLDLLAFQAGQLVEPHIEDRVGLELGQGELGDQGRAGLIAVRGSANDLHDRIHVVDRNAQAFEDVGARLGLGQVELRAARDDVESVIGEAADQPFQVHLVRLAVVNGQHDRPEGRLHLGVLVELVENHLGDHPALELDHDPDAQAIRFIAQVGDALDRLGRHQLGDILDQVGLVDCVGNLGDDDRVFVFVTLLDGGPAAYAHVATPFTVHALDPGRTADDAAGREVGSLDELEQVVDRAVRIIDLVNDGVGQFVEVVRWDVGRHADGDTGGAIQEQVGQPRRQHERLLERFIVVGTEINRVLLDIGQHLFGMAVHADFGVSHGGGVIAVDRAEVALAIHQQVAQ